MAPFVIPLIPEAADLALGAAAALGIIGAGELSHWTFLGPGIPLLQSLLHSTPNTTGASALNHADELASDASLVQQAQQVYAETTQQWAQVALATNAIVAIRAMVQTVHQTEQGDAAGLQAQIIGTQNQLANSVGYLEGLIASDLASVGAAISSGVSYSITTSENYTAATAATLNQAILQATADAKAYADAGDQAIIAGQAGVFAQLRAYIDSIHAQVESDITRQGALDQAYTDSQVAGLAATIPTTAQDVFNRGLDALDQAAHDAVIGPWAALLPDLGTITNALPTDIANTLHLPGILTQPVAGTIPGILSMALPALAGVIAETAICTVPMCGNLGDLSHLFGDLNTGLWLLALVALLAEAVTHPKVTADAIAAFAQPIEQLLTDLLGLVGL